MNGESEPSASFWEKMQPQDASDVKDERCKSECSSSSREPKAPLVTPVAGVTEEPAGPALTASSSVAEVKAEPAVNAWGDYRRTSDSAQDTRSDRRGTRSGGTRWDTTDTLAPNAWQQTNALGLEPGNYGGHRHLSGAHSWQTTTTADADARWELHRGYRAAPQNPAFPDYHARMTRAGQSLGWASWRSDNFADNATRRWDAGPYGADRPRRGGRGGRW